MPRGASFADVLTAVIWVAVATTIVRSPSTSKAFKAAGGAFSTSIRIATLSTGSKTARGGGAGA
jgi:hypothetical protein